MSHNIHFLDPETRDVVQFESPHSLAGGTYALGGTTEAWLNVTYNYSPYFYRVFGEKGIRTLYGLTGEQAIPLLEKAVAELGTERDPDYWAPTSGNAGAALADLLSLCRLVPEGILDGD